MNWDGNLPDSGWELAGLIALLAFTGQAIGGGIILKWHHNRNNEASAYRAGALQDRQALRETAEAIKGQVVNGHTQPLRADIDALKSHVADLKSDFQTIMSRQERWQSVMPVIMGLPDEIRGLRADIAEERESRRNLAADVRADMARHRDDMSDLNKRIRDAGG